MGTDADPGRTAAASCVVQGVPSPPGRFERQRRQDDRRRTVADPAASSARLNRGRSDPMASLWMGLAVAVVAGASALFPARAGETVTDGSVLPFPPTPSASVAGPTLQESRHVTRTEPNHLPPDAPNVLIVLLD